MTNKKVIYQIIFTIILIPLFYNTTQGASWPVFQADSERTGSKIEDAIPRLTPKWSYQIQGELVGSPVVYKGQVICGGRDNNVWVWDAYIGEVLQQYSLDGWIDSTPCVSSSTIYVTCRDKYVYALDRNSEEVTWKTYTGSQDCSSPILLNGKLYFVSGYPQKYLYCLDAGDGSILNSYAISQFGFSSPAIKDNVIFFGTNDGQYHAHDLDTGNNMWSLETHGGILYSTVGISDDYLYAVSGGDERKLYCLNPSDKNEIWVSTPITTKTSVVSSVTLDESNVFVVSTDGSTIKLFAFPLSGTSPVLPDWSTTIGIPHPVGVISSPAIANDVIYVGSGNGYLYALNKSNGQFITPATGALTTSTTGYYLSYNLTHSSGIVSSPAVANGWVYAGTYDGNFWAFEAETVTTISGPDNDDVVTDSVNIEGTVKDSSLTSYTLEYGLGENPSTWNEVATGASEKTRETISSWDTSDIPDGTVSLRLTTNVSSRKAMNRFTINNSPLSPTNLSVADTPFDGGGSLTLTWDKSGDDGAGDNDITGYKIYKSTYAGNYSFLAQVSAGAVTYTDTSCPVHTTYYYVLTGIDALSESSNSSSAAAFSIADGVLIDPDAGGTIDMGDGTEIIIAPNTFATAVRIGVRIPASYPDTGIPSSANDIGVVREFGVTPIDAEFLKSVTIKLPYTDQQVTNAVKRNLRIYWYDESKEKWRIVNTSDPNIEDGKVWATIPHFSLYRIMEYAPGREELISPESIYSYPNPARGTTLNFKYYLGDTADVTIDVYNVAGELIAHLEQTDNPAGIVSEIEWNIKGIASGVYIWRLEAKSASKKKSIKKKLAIIH